jgi:tetratricopeptide (TPR) repeat protein
MSKQTDKSLFIVSSLPRLYQALLSGIEGHKELGNRIIREIKTAQAFRQVEKVAELSQILVNNPIKEYQLIGQYYLAWSKYRGEENQPRILERVIEQSNTYRTKALISRAALEVYKGNHEHALYFYTESFKTNPTASDYIVASRGIATLKSIEGFKKSALKDLERLLPLLKHAEPFASADVQNSYAVELGEAGRKYEARNVIKHVLESPFIIAYPEWRETANELKEPDRSFISVPQIEHKPIEIETKKDHHASKSKQPSKVLSFPKLQEAPEPEQPDRVSPKELGEMTDTEKKELIIAALRTDAIRESQYDNLIFHAGMLKTGPASNVLDLEDNALLDALIMQWVNMIEPEEFAAVMSALRDCDDHIRQANLIDRMIQKAFEHSPAGHLSEEEWRLKFERRLPPEK